MWKPLETAYVKSVGGRVRSGRLRGTEMPTCWLFGPVDRPQPKPLIFPPNGPDNAIVQAHTVQGGVQYTRENGYPFQEGTGFPDSCSAVTCLRASGGRRRL